MPARRLGAGAPTSGPNLQVRTRFDKPDPVARPRVKVCNSADGEKPITPRRAARASVVGLKCRQGFLPGYFALPARFRP
jgi:hypothetical protein